MELDGNIITLEKPPARLGKKLTARKGQKNRGNLTGKNNKNWEMDFELCSRASRASGRTSAASDRVGQRGPRRSKGLQLCYYITPRKTVKKRVGNFIPLLCYCIIVPGHKNYLR